MRQSLCLLAGCLASLSIAMPADTYGGMDGSPKVNDVDILNYALTLEYLERKFYVDGLKNYTMQDFTKAGFSKDFYSKLQDIRRDEEAHVKFLSGALGDKAIKEPTFAFPVKDAKSFVGLSGVLEGVGVSAYLGAAPAIANKQYLTAAGSILTVEARHASYVRAALGQKPFPLPNDTPLDFNQVFSLAAQFVTGFAPGTKTPFKPFPALTVTPSKPGKVCSGKTSVKLQPKAMDKSAGKKMFAVFYSGLETYYVPVKGSGMEYTATVPGADFNKKGQEAPAGQVYVVMSSADGMSTKANDGNIVAGVGILEVEDCGKSSGY